MIVAASTGPTNTCFSGAFRAFDEGMRRSRTTRLPLQCGLANGSAYADTGRRTATTFSMSFRFGRVLRS